MVTRVATADKNTLTREVTESLVLLGLTGAWIGGFLGMVAVATRALGR
jgi:hypothetical protein